MPILRDSTLVVSYGHAGSFVFEDQFGVGDRAGADAADAGAGGVERTIQCGGDREEGQTAMTNMGLENDPFEGLLNYALREVSGAEPLVGLEQRVLAKVGESSPRLSSFSGAGRSSGGEALAVLPRWQSS
jgi:hypothetical protein